MMKRVLLVRHDDGPSDDRVMSFLAMNGLRADVRRPFLGDPLGEVTEDLAGTVLYGGMYNAYDTETHPFLNEEYHWIGQMLDAGLPMLGLCQGAQMIAHHQGAWVGAPDHGLHEFGYYEVTPLAEEFMPRPMHVAQAHFHTFDLPQGAVHLARSETYENQAFQIGEHVFGLQFHPEQTIEGMRRWQSQSTDLTERPGAQTRDVMTRLMHMHDETQAIWFYGFLAKLFGTTSSERA
ncbi:glutamine amidotransferase [Thalassococcus sp. S3]|uniref:glutamine amidotransferase-related protein n=1 Tax=Thalassococcus sp. S3 TaxID=2017482 RepID=UPI0010247736|nr:glutamine amidotransferase [Thalassococcus sp. S3]QBF33676.1 glutamine amidotransferase [Thalassococcus sp. S3]